MLLGVGKLKLMNGFVLTPMHEVNGRDRAILQVVVGVDGSGRPGPSTPSASAKGRTRQRARGQDGKRTRAWRARSR